MMRRSGWALIESVLPVLILAVLSVMFVPFFLRTRAQGQLTACRSNLKNLATALEMYARDSSGAYPSQLERLPPYLKQIPTCPAAATDSYTPAYQSASAAFTLSCQGEHHKKGGLGPGFPQYSASQGILDGPIAPGSSWLQTLLEGLRGVALMPAWSYFFYRLSERPPPMPQARALEERHPWIAYLAWLGWLSLCGILTSAFWIASLPLYRGQLSALIAPLLGAVSAEWSVRIGWRIWEKLSPVAPPDTNDPARGVGLRSRATLGEYRPVLPVFLRLGTPLLMLATLTLTPLIGTPSGRDSLLGLALAALLSFPVYLWAQSWATELFERDLELVPGSGVLLEHTRSWGQSRVSRLGTLAEVRDLTGDGFSLNQRSFRGVEESFVKALQAPP